MRDVGPTFIENKGSCVFPDVCYQFVIFVKYSDSRTSKFSNY